MLTDYLNIKLKFFMGIILLLFSYSGNAETISVDDPGDVGVISPGGTLTLREAILMANASPGLDTVVISFSDTLRLNSKLPLITEDLIIEGPMPVHFVINAMGNQIFDVSPGVSLMLEGAKLTGGSSGFILPVLTGRIELRFCLIEGNMTTPIYLNGSGAELSLYNCSVINNTSSSNGGAAIVNQGSLKVYNSTFGKNLAGMYGGSIYVSGSGQVSLQNCTFCQNQATEGGALYISLGNVYLENNLFDKNIASIGPNILGPISSNGYNFIEDSSGTSGFGVADIIGGPTFLGLIPKENGYGLKYYPISDTSSVCVDAGSINFVGKYDNRGAPRLLDATYANRVDIGAFEFTPFSVKVVSGTKDFNNILSMSNALAYAEPHYIEFDIAPVGGPFVINFGNNIVNKATIIDGWSQQGSMVPGPRKTISTGLTPGILPIEFSGVGTGVGLEFNFGVKDYEDLRGIAFMRYSIGVSVLCSDFHMSGCHFGFDYLGSNQSINDGVLIGDGSTVNPISNILIGGFRPYHRNVIGNALYDNIKVFPDVDNKIVIINNLIGSSSNGMAIINPLSNAKGIAIAGGDSVFVGGKFGKNLIVGNRPGIFIDGPVSKNVLIRNNFIGVGYDGINKLGNYQAGIEIINGSDIEIGGDQPWCGNLISGNMGEGIMIDTSSHISIKGNHIGVDESGDLALKNDNNGIFIRKGSYDIQIGDTSYWEANVICGNGKNGVMIDDLSSRDIQLIGNVIGKAKNMALSIPNAMNGIKIYRARKIFIKNNLISGNSSSLSAGILAHKVDSIEILRNIIGMDDLTSVQIPNDIGIRIDESHFVEIGGDWSNEGNIISGNLTNGLELVNGCTDVYVKSNFIGLDASGYNVFSNGKNGIFVNGSSSRKIFIGNDLPQWRNFICGSDSAGILINGADSVRIMGNYIGLKIDSTVGFPQNEVGIVVDGSSTKGGIIGGFGFSGHNIIGGSQKDGIQVLSGAEVAILKNVITGNGSGLGDLGIDLGDDGVTINDSPGDIDAGSNQLQNFPVLNTPTSTIDKTYISGFLSSTSSKKYRIDFYHIPVSSTNPSGYGEGFRHIGKVNTNTDVTGNAVFYHSVNFSLPKGDFITATATELDNLSLKPKFTSEFGENTVIGDTAIYSITYDDVTCSGGNDGRAYINLVSGNGLFTFTWYDGGAIVGIGDTVNNLIEGVYYAIVEDVNGYKDTSNLFTVIAQSNMIGNSTVLNASCNNVCDGSINLIVASGVPTYTYSWKKDGAGTAQSTSFGSGLCAGNYEINVTDALGCVYTHYDTVGVITDISASFIVSDTNLCMGDTITFSNTWAYPSATFSWNFGDGSPIDNNENTSHPFNVSGSYTSTLEIVEAACTSNVSLLITVFDLPVINILKDNDVSCNSVSDGQLSVALMTGAPLEGYFWSSGHTTSTASLLSAGTYDVDVIDTNGCLGNASYNLMQPLPLTLVSIKTDVLCNGGGDGQITTTATGGNPPYVYNWSGPISSSNSTELNLSPGTYCIDVDDANGCGMGGVVSVCETIVEPAPMVFDTVIVAESCPGNGNGTITISNVSGGNGGYQYSIDFVTYSGTYDFSGLTDGSYTVYLKDDSGCVESFPGMVVDSSINIPVFSYSSAQFCQNAPVQMPIITGTGFSTFSSTGITVNSATGLLDVSSGTAGTTYKVYLTSSDGCGLVDSASVTILATPMAISTGGGMYCQGEAYPTINIEFTGASPFTFDIDVDGNSYILDSLVSAFSTQITSGPSGTYVVSKVTDFNGCSVSSGFGNLLVNEIIVNPPKILGGDIYCIGDSIGVLSAIGSDSINWFMGPSFLDLGISDSLIPLNNAGMVKYYAKSLENGCFSQPDSAIVGILLMPKIVMPQIPEMCLGGGFVDLNITPPGGVFSGGGINGPRLDLLNMGVGSHWIYYTVSNVACVSTDSMQVNISDVTAKIAPVDDLCEVGDAVIVEAFPIGGTWTGNGMDYLSGEFSPQVAGIGDHLMTYSYKDPISGCTALDTFTIFVNDGRDCKTIHVYNAFSPNGDGKNETWRLEGIENATDVVVEVFNRWGDLIIRIENYDNISNVWDGRSIDGKELPDGTYFYVISGSDFISNQMNMSGYVQITR